MPTGGRHDTELARLRRRVGQQDLALSRLTEALLALRTGGQALRDENRELRAQLEMTRRHASILRAVPSDGQRGVPRRAQ
jgi:hypothetical protein